MKFRKKPVVVEAEQYVVDSAHPPGLCFCGAFMADFRYEAHVHTLEGELRVTEGDWVVTGTRGEHWPVRPDIFSETYEAVE